MSAPAISGTTAARPGGLLAWLQARRWGRKSVIGIPYLFLVLFFSLPFLVVLKISVSEADGVGLRN
jgi:putrescine transport system permease protein